MIEHKKRKILTLLSINSAMALLAVSQDFIPILLLLPMAISINIFYIGFSIYIDVINGMNRNKENYQAWRLERQKPSKSKDRAEVDTL